MCAKGASCGCGGAGGNVLAILASGVVLAGVVAVSAVIMDILEVLAVTVAASVPLTAGAIAWRVRYLTRPALVSRETSSVRKHQIASAPRAITAPAKALEGVVVGKPERLRVIR